MAQYYESNHRSFVADAAYARGLRVKLSGSTVNLVTVAGLTDQEIGTLTAATTAANTIPGLNCDVLLRSANGTQEFVASGAITANATVYTAASGFVSSSNPTGAIALGVALNATANSGDLVEVLRFNH